MRYVLLVLALFASTTQANETECLIQIVHAEAQGEPFAGLIAVAEASLNRASNQKRSVCKITGVTRKPVPTKLKHHYVALAHGVMSTKERTIKDADSWDKAKRPRYKGKIVARIGLHTFYKMG